MSAPKFTLAHDAALAAALESHAGLLESTAKEMAALTRGPLAGHRPGATERVIAVAESAATRGSHFRKVVTLLTHAGLLQEDLASRLVAILTLEAEAGMAPPTPSLASPHLAPRDREDLLTDDFALVCKEVAQALCDREDVRIAGATLGQWL